MLSRLAARLALRTAPALLSGVSRHAALRRLPRRTTAAGVLASSCASASLATAEPEEPIITQSVTLPDGRRLAFTEQGDPHGVAVFALHGMGSSHLTWHGALPLSEVAPRVRLIAVDRPGYGDSTDPPAGYSYAHFVKDLALLADELGVGQFCVVGHSSGGPYALAAAALLPDRVLACAAVSSDPPYNHPGVPDFVRKTDDMASEGPEGAGFYGVDPKDKVAKWRMSSLEKGPAAKRHAWKQGEQGFVTDFTLERLPYSFKIESITLQERLTFWYGSEDFPAMVYGNPWMQSLVRGSKLRRVKGGDHSFKSDPAHLSAILIELRDQAQRHLKSYEEESWQTNRSTRSKPRKPRRSSKREITETEQAMK
ncbi:hypothetical protein AB1Y20_021602 [Prymnesium parvum]|uniref:AB hydrolase-1 domain-containing protein n=1 Tax=Prymnesium parvum TaxID=97485 RepID=A0AB34JMP2_PRYPA